MMDIVFHPAAREEAVEGYLYYGLEDGELAAKQKPYYWYRRPKQHRDTGS